MPSIVKAYGEEFGLSNIDKMTNELNEEVSRNLVNAIKLVKSMEVNSMEELENGNFVENLVGALFEDGVLKENTKESLATLLHDFNSSYLFKNVASTQINKLIEGENYKVDARVLKYVESKIFGGATGENSPFFFEFFIDKICKNEP